MGTVRSLLHDLREVATRERTEGTTRRRPGDAARAVLAVLLLVPLILHAHHPTATEEAVVRLFDSIPTGARDALPDPLPARGAVGGGAAGGHRPAAPPLAPGARPRGRGRRGVGARSADGLPRARRRAVAGVPGHLRPHRRTPLPDGAPLGGGGDGAGGVTPPRPPDPPLRRGPGGAARALEPLPVARLPHRPHRRDRPRLGRRAPGRVDLRHPGGTTGTPPGRGGAGQARRAGDRPAPHVGATGRSRGVRRRAHATAAGPVRGRSRSGATKPTPSSWPARGATSRTATRRRRCSRVAVRRWSTRRT